MGVLEAVCSPERVFVRCRLTFDCVRGMLGSVCVGGTDVWVILLPFVDGTSV